MSADADNFITRLISLGFKVESTKLSAYRESQDYDDIGSEDHFTGPDVKFVNIHRESEHHFCISVTLKNGNTIHFGSPRISPMSQLTITGA
jgi:hypothetical protein